MLIDICSGLVGVDCCTTINIQIYCRYFQCPPNHGVFSVLGKVELLPETSDSVTETSVLNAGVCDVCVCMCDVYVDYIHSIFHTPQ